MHLSKKENILILILGIIFLVLYGICSYFNRFAVDDYYHIHDEYVFGIWGGMLEGYYNWGGRWTSYLLWDCVFHFHNSGFVLILYTFSIIFFFILSVFLLLRRTFEIFEISNMKNHIPGYAVLFSAFTFFFSFGKGEIWFWVQSTAMFIVSIIAFLTGLSFTLSRSKNFLRFFVIIICFTYAGGASETYAVSYLLFLLLIIASFFIFPKSEIIAKIKGRSFYKIIASLIFLTVAFIISILAPGNAIRASWLPEPSFLKTFYITFKELGKLVIFKFSMQLPWVFLFSIPFMYIGFIHGKTEEKKSIKKIFRPFLFSAIFLIVLLYILLFPSCYILSEVGPDRSLSLIIFLVAVFISFWSYYFGNYCLKNLFVIRSGFYISTIIIIVLTIAISITQFNIVSKYATALDERSTLLKNLQKNNNKKTIIVSKLPPSGYLYSAEISSDTNYFGNEHYRLGLLLDFKVKMEK
ncbi:MAG: hypothetical protein V1904_05025 [Bacteroidota bacterium]